MRSHHWRGGLTNRIRYYFCIVSSQLPLLEPEERVLSTLEHDGSRRWLFPRLSKGRFWHRRRVVAYLLIATYALLPFIKIGGKPAILLDIAKREFTFFGFTFLPTDTLLLAILVVGIFLTIFFATAIAGRVWCGWACPQTVYLEYVFRPIERLFTGRMGKGGKPDKSVSGVWKGALYVVYFLVCLHLANVFLSYFVGVERLHQWIWTSYPWQHPGPFALVMFITGLMMFDFCYWREQLCIIGCPYGRFQSVMLDKSSCIIGYDERRGEPRGRGRDRQAQGLGDCVNCSMCVHVCPTGIDIRDGLQLECIGCAQCIDACDEVMEKVGLPKGLIRYSSQEALAGAATRVIRPRVIIYASILLLLCGAFLTILFTKSPFDVSAIRARGTTFELTDSGEIQNNFRLRVTNRTSEQRSYEVTVATPKVVSITGDSAFTLEAGELTSEPVALLAPPRAFRAGVIQVTLKMTDDQGAEQEFRVPMLGP